jgi:hypothetical protein
MSQSTPTAATNDTRIEIVRPGGPQTLAVSEGDEITLHQGEIWTVEPSRRDPNDVERTRFDSLSHKTMLTLSSPAPRRPIIMPNSAAYLSDDDEIITGPRAVDPETGRYETAIDWPHEDQSLRPGETITYIDAKGNLKTAPCPETRGSHLELRPPQLDVSIASQATGVVTPSAWLLGQQDEVIPHGKGKPKVVSGRSYLVRNGVFARQKGYAEDRARHPLR